jgi:beta-aspartyl-peptidase (threonine type)
MRTSPFFLSAALLLFSHMISAQPNPPAAPPSTVRPVLVLHGGAGSGWSRTYRYPEWEARVQRAMTTALDSGYAILDRGGSALAAVEAAVRTMESSGVFNAGRGAVRTTTGAAELDAAIMDGATGKAGAIAGLTATKHPISAARAVADRTEHVFMVGVGANAFTRNIGMEQVGPEWFDLTLDPEHRVYYEKLKAWRAVQPKRSSNGSLLFDANPAEQMTLPPSPKMGTVGAVALDAQGHLAAATSTGGTDQKLPGRVGDVPVLGAGTYADSLVAISCTGHGEYYIRHVVAHSVACRVAYLHEPLDQATRHLIFTVLNENEGAGGLIAVDRLGNVSFPFNTTAMPVAIRKRGEADRILFYRD